MTDTAGPTTTPPHSPPGTAGDVTIEPALVDGVDVDAVARAVRACAGVADLYSGRLGEIGSYLPGRRVGGVQVDHDGVTVHIRARWGYGVQDLLAQVGAVTVALRNGHRLNLVVDDIDDDLAGAAGSAASVVNAVTAVAPPLAIDSTSDTRSTSPNPPLPESSAS